MTETQATEIKGYSFLIEDTDPDQVFTPEDLSEEHIQFAQTADEFIAQEVDPIMDQLETTDRELLAATIRKSGEIGLLMIEIPEEYDGLGLDLLSQLVVIERMGKAGGFAVAFGCQTGIGSEPILFFGTDEQKQKYLPKIATGEWIGAYGLTEPGSGSDALAARTTAKLSEDGTEYVLNGGKCFISNGGIADLFTIFAQVDGDQFTAFLVEKDMPGFTVGAEEHKLGIKCSTTTTLTLEDVRVPVGNLIGEVGKGHKIALNILNVGRLKLGIGAAGGMKQALNESISYGLQRKQFDTRVVDFPLIQQKIAGMVAAAYTSESLAYRASGDIDGRIKTASIDGKPNLDNQLAALEEFSGECAISKAYVSERLDYVVDEAVQIHGGYGYIEEYPVARWYRDARINRIFEGTNEINRMHISGTLFKRAMGGRLPLIQAVQQIQSIVLSPLEPFDGGGQPLADVAEAIQNAKRLFLFVSGVVTQKFMPDMAAIAKEQEVLAWLAEMVMEIYALESSYLRALKRAHAGDESAEAHEDVARFQMSDSVRLIEQRAKDLVDGYFVDDSRRQNLQIIKKFSKWPHVNRVELGRKIARASVDNEGYIFEVVA